jgi:hypothetical protein
VASAFVLVVVAALAAGVFFAALQEYRMGRNTAGERRAFDAAEAGLGVALGAPDLEALAVGESTAFSGPLPAGAGNYAGSIERLSTELLLVRSTGRDGGGTSERTLAMLARLVPVNLDVPAALVSAGAVDVGPAGSVDGFGAVPEGWDCAAPEDSVPGLLIGDSSRLRMADCGRSDCVRGSPGVQEDTAIRGASVPIFGEAGWAALLVRADTIGSEDETGGAGDRLSIVYVPGNLVLTGARSQGVLLVEGDVSLEEGSVFVGLVIARGRLTIRADGGRIVGAAVAASAEVGTGADGDSAAVVYSKCAVRGAVSATAVARPLAERSWAAIF